MLVGTLSVRECLQYAALLRLPRSMDHADKVRHLKPESWGQTLDLKPGPETWN